MLWRFSIYWVTISLGNHIVYILNFRIIGRGKTNIWLLVHEHHNGWQTRELRTPDINHKQFLYICTILAKSLEYPFLWNIVMLKNQKSDSGLTCANNSDVDCINYILKGNAMLKKNLHILMNKMNVFYIHLLQCTVD